MSDETFDDTDYCVVRVGFGRKTRDEVVVRVGGRYRIEPINPQKKKNRGRVCVVTKLRKSTTSPETIAYVKWEDTGKLGRTDIGEFLPAV